MTVTAGAWISHQEFFARDRATCAENRRRNRRPQLAMQDYARQTGMAGDPDCVGTLRFDAEATAPTEQHTLAVCDACGFDVAVPRHIADPDWRGRFMLEKSGLPEAFIDKAFARSGDNAAGMDACSDYLDNLLATKPPTLHGSPGVGKTHLLTRTGAALCRSGIRVLYRDYVSLLRAERDFMDRPAGVRPLQLCVDVEVLVIDDLGAERSTPWSQEQLQWLIDERYKNGRPILAATNVDVVDWPEEFGARAASRLAAMTEPTYMGGVDLRLTELARREPGTEAP